MAFRLRGYYWDQRHFFHLISSKSFSLAQCMTGSDFPTGHISNRQLDYFLCKHCVYCCLEKRVYCLLKLRLFVELVSPTPGGAPVWITHTLRVCGFFSLLTNLPSSVALVKVFLFQFLLKFLAYCTENIFFTTSNAHLANFVRASWNLSGEGGGVWQMAKTDEEFAMRYMIGKTSDWGKDAFSFKKANKIKTKWWRQKH